MRTAPLVLLVVTVAGCGLGYSIEERKEEQQSGSASASSTATTTPTSTETSAEPPPPPTSTSSSGGASGSSSGGASGSSGSTPSGTLLVDHNECAVSSIDAESGLPPCGNTWSVTAKGTCPGLGAVTLTVTSISGRAYPQTCVEEEFSCNDPTSGTTSATLAIGNSEDAGTPAPSNDCTISSGPTTDDPSNGVFVRGSANGHSFTFTD